MENKEEHKPCPFCGAKVVEHPNPDWRAQYLAIYHDPKCWLNEHEDAGDFTLMPRTYHLDRWNTRANS